MDSLKEIIDAINSRIRSPIFGSIAIMFAIINWKPLFYLLFAKISADKKFAFFDENTSTVSLFVLPFLFGILFAVVAPWIALLGSRIAELPITQRKILQTRSSDKILTEKLRLEKTRTQLLASEEQALIEAAKRDAEVSEIDDPNIRKQLKEEIEKLRLLTQEQQVKQLKMDGRTEEYRAMLDKQHAQNNALMKELSDLHNTQNRIQELHSRRQHARTTNDAKALETADQELVSRQTIRDNIIHKLSRLTRNS